jgi:hypothetical protein
MQHDGEEETMIALLFKILHRQRPNDFFELINCLTLTRCTSNDSLSRMGDAYHFISNLLTLSASVDRTCRSCIEAEIEKIKLEHQQQQQQQRSTATKASDLTADQK